MQLITGESFTDFIKTNGHYVMFVSDSPALHIDKIYKK